MADDTNKVTIDAAWFAELYAKANQSHNCDDCKEVHTRTRERDIAESKYKELAKERDELKAKLEESQKHYCTSATGNKAGDSCVVAKRCQELEAANEDLKSRVVSPEIKKHYYKLEDEFIGVNKRLAAAERCIEDVWNCLSPQEIADNEYAHIDIIRAYREKKEAK